MGIRQQLGNNRKLAIGLALGLLILGVGGVIYELATSASSGAAPPPPSQVQAFFSDDDGQTWFAAAADNLPPFDHGGKQAVRAYVFQGSNGKKFVGYLERYKPQALKALGTAKSAKPDLRGIAEAQVAGREIKRPGDKEWGPPVGPAAAKITTVQSPGGGPASPVEP